MLDREARPASSSAATHGGALDGVAIQELNGEARRAFEVDSDVKDGVVIVHMDPNSAAARAGLRPGDVIVEVNRTHVDTPQRFQEIYQKSKASVLLLVNR